MFEIRTTPEFDAWQAGLTDQVVRAAVLSRIVRLSMGNPGDAKPVGEGVSELRIHIGQGWRVYYVKAGATVIVLLCGGSKASQDRDIRRALRLAREL